MATKSLFAGHGVHALVDGQFGSTGKGVLASYLASQAHERGLRFAGTISNAGPNSGHTFYHKGEKHVLKQLPTFAVKTALLGSQAVAYLSSGAVIDPAILRVEAERYPGVQIRVHRNAAVILPQDKETEGHSSIAAVAGTRSGTGAALARRIYREPTAVIGAYEKYAGVTENGAWPPNVHFYGGWDVSRTGKSFDPQNNRYFMEVSQGFSLGIASQFYPKVTSRECTVMQGIADARIAPKWVSRTFMVARTFPIRVGNHEGHSSGGWYPDQTETSWEELGVEAELTTVTKRIRRVATFSVMQMRESIMANAPDFILWNFMNYLKEKEGDDFSRAIKGLHTELPVEWGDMWGYGPTDANITNPPF